MRGILADPDYRLQLVRRPGLTSGAGRRTGLRRPPRTTGYRRARPDLRAASSPWYRRRRTGPGSAAVPSPSSSHCSRNCSGMVTCRASSRRVPVTKPWPKRTAAEMRGSTTASRMPMAVIPSEIAESHGGAGTDSRSSVVARVRVTVGRVVAQLQRSLYRLKGRPGKPQHTGQPPLVDPGVEGGRADQPGSGGPARVAQLRRPSEAVDPRGARRVHLGFAHG